MFQPLHNSMLHIYKNSVNLKSLLKQGNPQQISLDIQLYIHQSINHFYIFPYHTDKIRIIKLKVLYENY